MYSGSAGVLYALFRYSLLLNNETNHMEPSWLDMRLHPAIDYNLKLANSRVCDGAIEKPSFLTSHTIGLTTLSILNILR